MAVLCCGMTGNAWAVKDSICFNDVDKPFYTNEVAETKAMKEKKQALKNLLKKMDNFCLQMQKKGLRKEETGLFSESHSSYINEAVSNFLKNNPNYKKQYDNLNKLYIEAQQAIEKQRTCDTNPYSCMTKEDKTQNLGTQQEAHSSCVSYHAKLKKCGASFSAAIPAGKPQHVIQKLQKTDPVIAQILKLLSRHYLKPVPWGKSFMAKNTAH